MIRWRAHSRALVVHAVLIAAAVSLAASILLEPWLGLGVAVVSVGLILRPFDPITALAVLAATASFVDNEGGHMTRDLSVVTLVAMYVVVTFASSRWQGRWRAPGGPMILSLVAFLGWTALSTLHGLLAGHPTQFIALEVAALGMLSFTWISAGLKISANDLRPALVILIAAGLGHVLLGVVSYGVNHIRTGGIWYTPLPGMLAIVALCFGLNARTPVARAGWALLLGLFLLHQTISFSRGYWLGLLVALPWTALMFVRLGPKARERWGRLGMMAALAAGVLALTALATATVMEWSDLPALLGTRFGSSFSTKNSSVSASNMARLLEYAASFRYIQEHLFVGHGMGLELRIRDPFFHVVTRQAYVHQTYLWLWLKQGLVGLALFLTLLVHAIRTALAGARSDDKETAAWCLSAAGATVFLAVVNLTTFHLAQVNATTLQAILWGLALAMTKPVHWRLVWREKLSLATPAQRAGPDLTVG